ncbi:MAG: hypothetical protein E7052_06915 [Lentisphaerae bacterium]|nr:hypothetical protein [Lentisphaerota bacterium]
MLVNIELQKPQQVCSLPGGGFFADFGKAAFGRLEVVAHCSKACTVELAMGEVLTPEKRLDREPGGYRCIKIMTKELAAGENRFFMDIPKHRSPYQKTYQRSKVLTPENIGGEIAPFRYVEITGDFQGQVEFIRHAVFGEFDDNAAAFECSDERLNKVWEFCKYSIKATSCFGIYVDGERERQAFEGDCYINALGAYCSGGGYEIARRTLGFMIEYYPIPALEYRLITPRLVHDYMLYSGDEQSLHFWQKTLPERLCRQYLNSDGLIENPEFIDIDDYRKDMPYQYFPLFQDPMQLLVDWPPNERDDYEYGAVNFVSNAFYYDALNMLDRLLPGRGYAQTAQELRKKMQQLFRQANGRWRDNTTAEHMALHTAVLALALGVADAHDRPQLGDFIVQKGMQCSVYMAQFLLDSCFISGQAQYAIDLMRSDSERSWLNMIKQGSTISMEAWSNELKPNQDWNHAWGAAPANVIPRRLAGIRPESYGFKKFVVDPQVGDIKEMTMRHPSPQGAIELEYSNKKLQLTVPDGAEACCDNKLYGVGKHTIKLA